MGDELDIDKTRKDAAFKSHVLPLARYINHNYLLNISISAAILIAVSLEEDINSFLRIGFSAKGFSHKQVTRFISETSTKTKIELIFPLLGLNFPEQYRIAVYEFVH